MCVTFCENSPFFSDNMLCFLYLEERKYIYQHSSLHLSNKSLTVGTPVFIFKCYNICFPRDVLVRFYICGSE